MKILGISAFYHDSAAAIVCYGVIIAAAQEERFSRVKHDDRFPEQAIKYCLAEAKLSLSELDFIVFYEKPFLKFERLLETYLSFAPRGFKSFATAMPLWIKEKLLQKKLITKLLGKMEPKANIQAKMLFSDHHQAHAASTFFPSPFAEAIVLTMDGVGEWATTSVSIGKNNSLQCVREIHFPHSLGLLYSAFTYYCGFKVNSGEYKLMGLAPYGQPIYVDLILEKLIDLKPDGSFRLDMQYFDYCVGFTMTNREFNNLFGGSPRTAESPITQKEKDLAASIQVVLETAVLKLARSLRTEYKIPNLCLAGGVALNCVANGKILKERIFDQIWIQPAAGDAGGALGAALAATYIHANTTRIISKNDSMHGAYLGPAFSTQTIEQSLGNLGAKFTVLSTTELLQQTAKLLAQNLVVGWFQGRMEFGPRALGSRSILANPCDPEMQRNLNLKIKYRESFRPFAPAILAEDLQEWFILKNVSPYMLFTADLSDSKRNPNSVIPAVTHIDFSARVQTVHRETNPEFYQLLVEFKKLTGCPILINTSFNIRGEPIVCTPEDAFRCFMGTEMDSLIIGNCRLDKSDQDPVLSKSYAHAFALD